MMLAEQKYLVSREARHRVVRASPFFHPPPPSHYPPVLSAYASTYGRLTRWAVIPPPRLLESGASFAPPRERRRVAEATEAAGRVEARGWDDRGLSLRE